jgi:acetoacetate decarboxylase
MKNRRSTRNRILDAADEPRLSDWTIPVRRPRIHDHHVPHGHREAARARAGAARGVHGSRPLRVHPDHPPIAGGRELWGFPKKLASPKLETHIDALVGTLDFGPVRIATGTMGYKHTTLDAEAERVKMSGDNYLLKIIPHVDGTPRIGEIVRYHLQDVHVKGAWGGPASLSLSSHALAPVGDLPVLEVVEARHIIADLTLALGEVAFDYLVADQESR